MEGKTELLVKAARIEDDNSPRKAWYELSILKLLDGYIIQKCSGCSGSRKNNTEMWFRFTLEAAELKFQMILQRKTNPDRKSSRHYELKTQPQSQTQLELF